MSQKTLRPKVLKESDRKWYLVDAAGKTAGRLSTEIANLLRGKDKADFTPEQDMGDHVVVINAEKVVFTGHKEEQKTYFSHSGYLGHGRLKSVPHMREFKPEFILEYCVNGMIPRNRLKRKVLAKLHVYAGETHPHAGQNPTPINL